MPELDAVTLINTLMGMVIDVETGVPALGSGPSGGGLSGAAVHPVAVRTVFDVHAALPELPIIGVGGISDARGALEMVMAGADAVQVGTASFAEPPQCRHRACGSGTLVHQPRRRIRGRTERTRTWVTSNRPQVGEAVPDSVRSRLALALDLDDLVEAHRLATEMRPWFGWPRSASSCSARPVLTRWGS
ncbi:MAG: hypothetical protein M5U19_04580 [Microthrixaceae bacterium]|nr:hypothetical protein [Microthrixaceae bacterium]